jgi:hypothetical protein
MIWHGEGMAQERMDVTRLAGPAAALIAIQVIHGAIPADTSAEGNFGLIIGAVALVASIAAFVGARRGRAWARPILGINGASLAVGFVLYHALPIHSAFTNPYFGEDKVGLLQWTPVILAVAIGAWAAYEAYRTEPGPSPAIA